jgi:hypothetical protein
LPRVEHRDERDLVDAELAQLGREREQALGERVGKAVRVTAHQQLLDREPARRGRRLADEHGVRGGGPFLHELRRRGRRALEQERVRPEVPRRLVLGQRLKHASIELGRTGAADDGKRDRVPHPVDPGRVWRAGSSAERIAHPRGQRSEPHLASGVGKRRAQRRRAPHLVVRRGREVALRRADHRLDAAGAAGLIARVHLVDVLLELPQQERGRKAPP